MVATPWSNPKRNPFMRYLILVRNLIYHKHFIESHEIPLAVAYVTARKEKNADIRRYETARGKA